MPTVSDQLRTAIEGSHDDLLAIARRLMELQPESRDYTDDELDQLLRGFEQMLLDELTDGDSGTRAFFLETAIPAVVAGGEALRTLIAGAARWAVLLTSYLVGRVDAEVRDEAAVWLAAFFGDYVKDLVDAAGGAER